MSFTIDLSGRLCIWVGVHILIGKCGEHLGGGVCVRNSVYCSVC